MRIYILTGMACAVLTPVAWAAEVDGDAIVVTATRTAVTADESLSPVTVITREEIVRAKSLPDLLRGLPGVDLAQNGGMGQNTSLYLRGTNSGHALLLIDGVKVGSATLGQVAWQHLPVEQIERIEIVRGPHSALYGSEAMGGVVQIFTRKGKKGWRLDAKGGVGNRDSRETSLTFSGGNDDTDLSVSHAHTATHGFDAWHPTTSQDDPRGIHDDDRDGYRNHSLSGRLGHRFAGGHEVEVFGLRSEGQTFFDATSPFDPVNESQFVQQALGAKVTLLPTDVITTTLSAGASRDESENLANGTPSTDIYTSRGTFSLQNDVQLHEDHLLTLGADWLEDHVTGSSSYERSRRYDAALFAQHQASFGAHDLTLGLRRGHNESFGKHTTGRAAWGYDLPFYDLRTTASYGTAYKAPTFNDLYFPRTAFGGGNPALTPEESKSWELGLSQSLPWGKWQVQGYYTRVENLIEWRPATDNAFFWSPVNVGLARIRGVEAEVEASVADWDLTAAVTITDPKNGDTGQRLTRRAQKSLKVTAGRDFDQWRLDLSWQVAGNRYNDAANRERLSGYGLVDVDVGYALSEEWTLRASVDNLFDARYETVHAYRGPGRTAMLTLGWSHDLAGE